MPVARPKTEFMSAFDQTYEFALPHMDVCFSPVRTINIHPDNCNYAE